MTNEEYLSNLKAALKWALTTPKDTEGRRETLRNLRASIKKVEALLETEDAVLVPRQVLVDAARLALEVIDPDMTPEQRRDLAETVCEATSEWTEDE